MKRGVYKVVARDEAMRVAGKVIHTMWIDSNKGDDEKKTIGAVSSPRNSEDLTTFLSLPETLRLRASGL